MSRADRQAIPKRLRFEVFKRDAFRCVYCGATPSDTVLLECDHVEPVAEGGPTEMDNLVTACRNCNRGKGAVSLSVVPQSLEDKATEVAEREEQIRAYYEILHARKERRDDEMWAVAQVYMDRFHEDGIQRRYLASIRTFLDRLDFPEVLEAMEISVDRQFSKGPAFRYFCGICWRKIRRADGEDI